MRVKKWANVIIRFVLQTRVHINLPSPKIERCGQNFEIEVLALYLKFLGKIFDKKKYEIRIINVRKIA